MTVITKDIELAAQLLQQEKVVAIPTETVYGLAASALSIKAITQIFTIKQRPMDNPLIVHVSSLEMLTRLGIEIPTQYLPIVNQFWPGPLTIIVPKPDIVPLVVTGGGNTMAVRIPFHPTTLTLIEKVGPLAAPSANLSTRPSPTTPQHVLKDLQDKIEVILDGGICSSGLESTVLNWMDINNPMILRPGGITFETLSTLIPNLSIARKSTASIPMTPGMKYKHYTPSCPLILIEYGHDQISRLLKCIQNNESKRVGVLTTTTLPSIVGNVMVYPLGTNTKEIAKNLFMGLRELETTCDVILVQGVEEMEEGMAIMNRIRKAAGDVF